MNDMLSTEFSDNEQYCLIFALDGKLYGINTENILEIINLPKLDSPQKMPKHVLGVITYNKTTIKVVDLCSMLNHSTKQYSLDSQLIITKIGNTTFGIIIDKAINVRHIRPKNIQALPYHSEDNLIQFMYKIKDSYISILDLVAINNLVRSTQTQINETNFNQLIPQDENSQLMFEKRKQELINKFDQNLPQTYYEQEQYIIFVLGKNYYAIEIQYVKEIVKLKNISLIKLPSKHDSLEGIFNLRGDFISVFNFTKFLGLNPKDSDTSNNMLIVLELKEFKIALLVDKIQDIVNVNAKDTTSQLNAKADSRYGLRELHIDSKVISVINIDKLIADDRLYIKD